MLGPPRRSELPSHGRGQVKPVIAPDNQAAAGSQAAMELQAGVNGPGRIYAGSRSAQVPQLEPPPQAAGGKVYPRPAVLEPDPGLKGTSWASILPAAKKSVARTKTAADPRRVVFMVLPSFRCVYQGDRRQDPPAVSSSTAAELPPCQGRLTRLETRHSVESKAPARCRIRPAI